LTESYPEAVDIPDDEFPHAIDGFVWLFDGVDVAPQRS
jgi:hypothetical protein